MNQSKNDTTVSDLADYEVLVAVGGGIAAYKACHVVSQLVQRGCGVTVAMTPAGTRFVGPLTFQTLTGRQVYTSLWTTEQAYDPQHISLTEKADLFLVAPTTANLIGKFASGLADEMVSTLMMAHNCPVLLAPAMNTRMWDNPVLHSNIARLRDLGFEFVDPEEGRLACGTVGQGRMAEPETIIVAVESRLKQNPPRSSQTINP